VSGKHGHAPSRAPGLARAALFGLIVVDLAANAWGVNPTFDPAYLAEPRWLSVIHEHSDSRFYVGGKTGGTLDASDLDSARAYMNPPGLSGSASRAALSGQANFDPSGWRSREMLSYDLAVLWPRDFATMSTRFFLSGRTERDLLLDRAGVRYRVLPRQQAGGRTPIVQVPYLMESFLFDYGGDVAPRVTVISKAEVVGDSGRQIEALFTGGWDSRSTAIIDREPAAAGDARPPVPPTATITTDSANRVVVQAGAGEAGGYVVLLDSFSDGWRATVDRHPATIVRANGLFRAVRLNPGPHVVELLYRPRAFLVGAAVSAAALAMVLGLLAWPALARRSVPRSCRPAAAMN
jgi:Bacterial membrane protein YfhO